MDLSKFRAHIDQLSREQGDPTGGVLRNVIDGVSAGIPIDELEPLMQARGRASRRSLAAIMSEIGAKAAEKPEWLSALLDDDDLLVQHRSAQAVLWSNCQDGEVVVKAIGSEGDPLPKRSASALLLSMASIAALQSARSVAPPREAELIAMVAAGDEIDLLEAFSRGSDVFKVAAAYRLATQQEPKYLDRLVASADAEVSQIAAYVSGFRPLPKDGLDVWNRLQERE